MCAVVEYGGRNAGILISCLSFLSAEFRLVSAFDTSRRAIWSDRDMGHAAVSGQVPVRGCCFPVAIAWTTPL